MEASAATWGKGRKGRLGVHLLAYCVQGDVCAPWPLS